MKKFNRSNHFAEKNSGRGNRRDSDKPEYGTKKFIGGSPRKFVKSTDRPKSFSSKESRSGNGFKLYEAVCDKCGKKCDLPFEPTGGKPIYCRSCFRENKGESGHKDRFESKRFDDRQESDMPATSSERLDAINRKLDKIMKALKID